GPLGWWVTESRPQCLRLRAAPLSPLTCSGPHGLRDMDQELEDAKRRGALSAILSGDDSVKPAAALVRAEFGARSHRGRIQPDNDDHFLVLRFSRRQETLLTSLASVDLPDGFEEYAYGA